MEEKNDIKYGQLWARHSELIELDAVGKYRITFEGLKKAVEEAMTIVGNPIQQTLPDHANGVIEKILKARDALIVGDKDEAYHQLYGIASPQYDKYFPWEEMEKQVNYPKLTEEQIKARKEFDGRYYPQLELVWVRCSERMPEPQDIRLLTCKWHHGVTSHYGVGALTANQLSDRVKGNIEWVYLWLDESGIPAAGITQQQADLIREANNRDLEGVIAKQDIEDGKELTAHYRHIEACEEKEAMALLSWLNKKEWSGVGNDEYINHNTQRIVKEAKLYQEFKQQTP